MVLHSVEGPAGDDSDDGPDVDADAGFFEMSPASAEQVTIQIRSMMERAWEYIAIAYQGRAHIALGYETWDEYVDDRLSDLRLTVPREQRGAVVQSLSRAQMSLRAIAKVLGVDPATVHRALGVADPTGANDADEPAPIRGRDGKSYPRRRQQHAATECSICGEMHEEPSDECPWDRFAQGLGPRPIRKDDSPKGPRRRESPEVVEVEEPRMQPQELESKAHPGQVDVEGSRAVKIVDSVSQAVCLVEELARLPRLIDEIEILVASAGNAGLADGVRELIEHLRYQADAIISLANRLERVALQN